MDIAFLASRVRRLDDGHYTDGACNGNATRVSREDNSPALCGRGLHKLTVGLSRRMPDATMTPPKLSARRVANRMIQKGVPMSFSSISSQLVALSIRKVLVVLLVLLGVSENAQAQTNSQLYSGVQFDFPLPGARSLALGGAFVAVADDATAALANPAGLTLLQRPEVSIEGRGWQYTNLVTTRGHAFGPATGVGVDTINGLVDDEFDDSKSGVSFLSVVIPRGRFAFGFYRHQQAQYRASLQSEGPFLSVPGSDDRLEPFLGQMDLDITNYGGSVAYRWGNGVAVGGSLAFSDLTLDSELSGFINPPPIFLIQPESQRVLYTAVGQAYGPADFSDSNVLGRIFEQGDDSGLSANAGVLIKPAAAKWSVGASFRLGAEFSYEARNVAGPRWLPANEIGQVIDQETVTFKVPDTYSVGATYRPVDRFMLTAQDDRVQFSQMSEDIKEVFGIDQSNPPAAEAIEEGLRFPDSNQFRVGVEYVVPSGERIYALRIGTAYETEHRMRYERDEPPRFARLEVLFHPGDDQFHFAPGFGVAFPRFQIDGAYDFSELSQTLSISAVYRF